MKKGNIIDLIMYQNLHVSKNSETDSHISEELKKAIQNLIHQMRELGPIKKKS